MSRGYVYVLSNPHMPGLVKIGKTTRSVEARASELYQTGVPAPFKVECQVLTPNCDEMEALAHREFAPARVSDGREFFKACASDVEKTLMEILDEQVNEFVDEFMPDCSIVAGDFFVDPSALSIIGTVTGVPAPDVRQVLEEIRCDDDAFDFEILAARLETRRKRQRAAASDRVSA